jgi:hypothetical protein
VQTTLAALRRLRKPTVDSVLASFTKAIADLRGIAEKKSDEAMMLNAQRTALAYKELDAIDESRRAAEVAGRLEKLVG